MTIPAFGFRQLNKLEETMNLLAQQIPKGVLQTRPGPGGRQLVYVSTAAAIHQANTAFGPAAWSSEIKELSQNFVRHDSIFHASYSAIIRVTLENGCFHEDVGSGNADNADYGMAIQTAKKAAVSDGIKRCLRYFGDYLGRTLRSGGTGEYAQAQTATVFDELAAIIRPLLNGELTRQEPNAAKDQRENVQFSTCVAPKTIDQVPIKIEPQPAPQPTPTPKPMQMTVKTTEEKAVAESGRKLIKIVKKSQISQSSYDQQRTKIVIKRKSQKSSE